MRAKDILLAVLVAVLWGAAFPAIAIGLDSFSPAQLVALRFLFAAVLVLFVARPGLSWPSLLLIGFTLFAGQFLLLFTGYKAGMPPGVASVVMQSQAFFTVIIAAFWLQDRPTVRQVIGMAVSFTGMALIGLTVDLDLTYLGLALTLGGALSWAIGNVLLKRTPQTPNLGLIAWLSLVVPVPALVFSILFENTQPLWTAVASSSWQSLAAAAYLGIGASLVAYAIWADLLRRFSTAAVAPYALLAPCVGMAASAALFGEQFGPLRFTALALVMLGLTINVLPIPLFGSGKGHGGK